MPKSRLFVIDPVCAMEYGHSLNALKYFKDMAAPSFDEAIMVASQHLPGEMSQDAIVRHFEFQYDQFLKIDRRPAPKPLLPFARKVGSPRAVSAADFNQLLLEHDITAHDTLLFPSIDYYSAVGILAVLEGIAPDQAPHLLIRLIGVMETACLDLPAPQAFNDLINRLKGYHRQGGRMTLCGETPKYSRRLSNELGFEVLTVPYFSPDVDATAMPVAGPVTFLSGGSARPDKGFFRLNSIITKVNQQIGAHKARFIVQGLPDEQWHQNISYIRSLYAQPNVELLSGQIPYSEIQRTFNASHVGLMPYDPAVYEWRGSAMLMESMLFERLTICQSNTGFSEQARLYNAGQVCNTDDDFVEAICAYAMMKPAELNIYAKMARDRYLQDVKSACDTWISGAL